jgi:hypothetical protein
MCILSGLFGAMFAVACGAVSGVGDKVANASDVLLAKYVVTGTCSFNFDGDSFAATTEYPSEYDNAMDDIIQNNAVYSLNEVCYCYDFDQDFECDSENSNDTFKLVYIK